jgi:hypothetical protein
VANHNCTNPLHLLLLLLLLLLPPQILPAHVIAALHQQLATAPAASQQQQQQLHRHAAPTGSSTHTSIQEVSDAQVLGGEGGVMV